MPFDVEAARGAGYSESEIADYLAPRSNFDLKGAQEAGYSPSEIVGHLASLKPPGEKSAGFGANLVSTAAAISDAAPQPEAVPASPPAAPAAVAPAEESRGPVDEAFVPAGTTAGAKPTAQLLQELADMPLAERATRIAVGLPVGAAEAAIQMASQIPAMVAQVGGFAKALSEGKMTEEDFRKATEEVTPKWVSDLAQADVLQPHTYAGALAAHGLGEGFKQAGRAAAAPGAGLVASTEAALAGEGTEGAKKRYAELYGKIAPLTEQLLNAGVIAQGAASMAKGRHASAGEQAPLPAAEVLETPTASTVNVDGLPLDTQLDAILKAPITEIKGGGEGPLPVDKTPETQGSPVDKAPELQGNGAEAAIAGEPAARLRPAPVPEEGASFDFETTFPKPADDSGIPTEQTANTHGEVMDVLRAARTEDAPEVYRNVLDVYRQTFGDDAARQLDERISKEVDDGRSRVQPDAADGERGAEGVARPADAEGQVVGNEAAEGRAAASLEDVGAGRARAVEDQAARDGTKPAVGETKPAEAETIAGVPEAPAAQPDTAARGAPERADVPSRAVAQGAAEAQAPEGVEDYTTRKGEVKTFPTKKEAELFRSENRVPKTFSPRKAGRGEWTLSRAARSEDEAQRQAEKAQRQYRERARIKPTDSLATMIGKLGGISRDALLRDGVDPADLKQLRSGVVGRPVARAKGLSLDALAEHLDGYGFDLRDEHGAIDASKLRDLIDEELQGNSVHTPEGYEHLASMAADARERAERLHRENNFSEDDLRRAGYDDLSEEAQTFLQHAFEEEADRHLATKDTKETISDEEAGRLFDEWAQATEEQVPGARAGRAREGAEGAETAARHEGEPPPAGVDKPGLELKGETEQEIRNREALAKRKQAEQAARDKAPNPEDFALTGSDRAVDVAEAHGQDALFSRNSGPHRARNIDALARDLAPKVHDAPNGTKIIANGQVAFSKERNVMNLGGGDRRVTFTIHDRTRPDANGKATAGGALIVDMDKYGLFKGIRSIEIHRDLRQKGIGLGERAVAMMIAHNKGAPIEVHDIQHAGVQGTAADALPFWRKMGVRLRNFSSDPNVAMDGVLKRDDYLNALDERGKVWRSDGTLTGNDRLEEGARAPESGAPQPDAGAGQGKRGSGGDDRPGGPAEGAGREAGRDVKPDEPKLARREQPTEKAPQRGLSSSELSDVAKRLDVAARVVDTEAELPDHLRKQIEAQGASGDVRGVYDPTTGAVWLVGSAIHSRVEAVTVALHESAHRGLAKLFGPELRPILGEIYARNDLVRTRANGMMREFKYTQARATEEVLADMALHGSARNLNGWERFVSFVRDWLLKRGVKFDLSDDAVEFIAGAAAKAGKEGAPVFTRQIPGESKLARGQGAPETEGNKPLSPAGPIDRLMAAAGGRVLAEKITQPVYDRLMDLGRFVPEKVKAGVVSDYALPESYLDRRTEMRIAQKAGAKKAQENVELLTGLDRAQSRVAYQWMTERDAEGDRLLKSLPEAQQSALRSLKDYITDLGRQAVALGQLSPEAFARNENAYLHRTYAKFELDDTKQEKAARAKSIRVLGDQYKGRGIVDEVEAETLTGSTAKGTKYIRLEQRTAATPGEVERGAEAGSQRLRRVVYAPANLPVPARYAAWARDAGTWEVRYPPTEGGSKVGLWRDFTADERQRMGELDEVKYATAKTLMMMTRDIETGRFMKWVADEHAKDSVDGLNVAATPTGHLLQAFKKDEWVQVPESSVPGTETKVYGELAGKWVPAPMWNDIRQVSSMKFNPFGDDYAALLRMWKTAKTALSPAVHTNNVMSNFVLADMADVGVHDLFRSLKVFADAKLSKDAEATKLLDRYDMSGGELGSYALSELQKKTLQPLLDDLRREIGERDEMGGLAHGAAAINALMHGDLRGAAEEVRNTTGGRITEKAMQAMIKAYHSEDQAFRFATWLKAVNEGKSDIEAGKLARDAFLNYDINAPWVQNARATFLPFVAFTYRAVPLLLKAAAERPWKFAKYYAIAGGLNALAYGMLGLTDKDEERERKLLPEEKTGRIWGVFQRLVRLPWNTGGQPTFLDIRRWIPSGDVIDFGQHEPAVPIPASLFPGGPLIMLAEVALNKQAFNGKPITLETDTPAEKAKKFRDYLLQSALPNLPFLPGSYSFDSLINAGKGKTDAFGREMSLRQAAENTVGIKEGSYPRDVLLKNLEGKLTHDMLEIDTEFAKVKREFLRKGIDRAEFDEKTKEMVEKKKKLRLEFAEKVRGS
jgi:hypothetical protein